MSENEEPVIDESASAIEKARKERDQRLRDTLEERNTEFSLPGFQTPVALTAMALACVSFLLVTIAPYIAQIVACCLAVAAIFNMRGDLLLKDIDKKRGKNLIIAAFILSGISILFNYDVKNRPIVYINEVTPSITVFFNALKVNEWKKARAVIEKGKQRTYTSRSLRSDVIFWNRVHGRIISVEVIEATPRGSKSPIYDARARVSFFKEDESKSFSATALITMIKVQGGFVIDTYEMQSEELKTKKGQGVQDKPITEIENEIFLIN